MFDRHMIGLGLNQIPPVKPLNLHPGLATKMLFVLVQEIPSARPTVETLPTAKQIMNLANCFVGTKEMLSAIIDHRSNIRQSHLAPVKLTRKSVELAVACV